MMSLDPRQAPRAAVRRRAIAISAAVLLPSGTGLVVLGRPWRAVLWSGAVLAAYALGMFWPGKWIALLSALALASILDTMLVSAPERGTRGPIVTALLTVLFLSATWSARWAERRYWLEPFRIPAHSMAPTLLDGDHVLVDRRPWDFRRGDVVVYNGAGLHEPDPGEDFIKRVVAGPGDAVLVREGRVFVNGEAAASSDVGACADEDFAFADRDCVLRRETDAKRNSYVIAYSKSMDVGAFPDFPKRGCPSPMRFENDTCVVPNDYVFVMGDNRNHSYDSRFAGAVPISSIKGRVVGVHLSLSGLKIRWERIGRRPSDA